MNYTEIYNEALASNRYISHVAGDTASFRYPHLAYFDEHFLYDEKRKLFRFKMDGDAPNTIQKDTLKKICAEDITVYEFITSKSKKLHISDMLGLSYTDKDKDMAMQAVLEAYNDKSKIFENTFIECVYLKDFIVDKDFAYLSSLYEELDDEPIIVCHVANKENDSPFPFGSVVKGTNLIITDDNVCNLGQDIVHMLFHLKEGIPGVDNDNMFVDEIWSDVPNLYAHQLVKGRMGRRIRKKSSPHIIHFQDYIYLRAYLGQWILCTDKTKSAFHPVYAILEPAMQFIFEALKDESAYDLNRIIADAILCDKTDELIDKFDRRFGNGSFRHIYGTYSAYDKQNLALEYMSKEEASRIMFESKTHIRTNLDSEYVKNFWRKKTSENITTLPACLL